jgi:hypothetical protein
MATLIAYCVRNGHIDQKILDSICYLNTHLAPPGLRPREALVSTRQQVCLAALNPSPNTEICESAVSAGVRHESNNDWALPNDDIPDGSFGLLRADEQALQAVTDPTGSRTIWYLHAEDYFIASTSQRAIVALARSFQLNAQASAWMLSTGALGPWHSWDERIRMVPPNSIASLNLFNWTLTEDIRQYEYCAEEQSEDYFINELEEKLGKIFATVGNYSPDWIIPLSGGVDSRGIMLWLPEPRRFKYVTWGSKAANGNQASDAAVAAKLARKYDLEHRYVPLQERIGNPESFFAKFIAAGEGRINNISGYLDEFTFWEELHSSDCPGMLRGDQVFGGPPLARPVKILELQKLCRLSDMPMPFRSMARHFPDQNVPPQLQRRSGETLHSWRCRVELHFRAPVVRAALNELKHPYTDVVNPLQFRPIVDLVVRMPDRFRTDKKLFARLVTEREPGVALATNNAIMHASDVVKEKHTNEFLMDGVSTLDSDVYLPGELLRQVRALNAATGRISSSAAPRASLWRRARNRVRYYVGGAMVTPPQLLLRSYLAISASRMLTNDAYFLDKIRDDTAQEERPADRAAG